jgi:hypothetical protein
MLQGRRGPVLSVDIKSGEVVSTFDSNQKFEF